MKTLRFLAPTFMCAASIVMGTAFPGLALMNDHSYQTDKDKLVKNGYTCVRVSVNFIECTKANAPRQWCTDDGTCQAAPRVTVTDPFIDASPFYSPGNAREIYSF